MVGYEIYIYIMYVCMYAYAYMYILVLIIIKKCIGVVIQRVEVFSYVRGIGSRDLLCTIVSIVNNMVLWTLKSHFFCFKDLMCSRESTQAGRRTEAELETDSQGNFAGLSSRTLGS